uniref:Peptidase S1 domain-containing protein n=2 Tax=Clastoptera arizonana TaxID=38151 RepID=A0A1B6CWC8_9HEMI
MQFLIFVVFLIGLIVFQPAATRTNYVPDLSNNFSVIEDSFQRTTKYKTNYSTAYSYSKHYDSDYSRTIHEVSKIQTTQSLPIWNSDSFEGSSSSPQRKRISQIKCDGYGKLVTRTVQALPLSLGADVVSLTIQKCEFNAAKLIVGGSNAESGEFPHMAAVGFHTRDGSISWNCGGSLISEEFVLTAAHCSNTTYGDPIVVRLGTINLNEDYNGDDYRDYRVVEVIPHPRYVPPFKYNDIALLRLSETVRVTTKIHPACLSNSEFFLKKPIATGWGRTAFVGKVSSILKKVELSIIDNTQCNNLYNQDKMNSKYFRNGVVSSMLCAGELSGGKDTCLGDSGGPLQVIDESNKCIHHIIGVTSFGKVCGAVNSPGVYTRTSHYLSWIESIVWGKYFDVDI